VLETLGFDPFMEFDAGDVALNFCLSRNRHGAGFFDSEWLVDGVNYARELQDAAKTFGGVDVEVWVDEGGALKVEIR
jgi:hypothetical protein